MHLIFNVVKTRIEGNAVTKLQAGQTVSHIA